MGAEGVKVRVNPSEQLRRHPASRKSAESHAEGHESPSEGGARPSSSLASRVHNRRCHKPDVSSSHAEWRLHQHWHHHQHHQRHQRRHVAQHRHRRVGQYQHPQQDSPVPVHHHVWLLLLLLLPLLLLLRQWPHVKSPEESTTGTCDSIHLQHSKGKSARRRYRRLFNLLRCNLFSGQWGPRSTEPLISLHAGKGAMMARCKWQDF
mmetsp:Transcript_69862/g.123916  ORF Transcript_69862/g.123916 Transcript_69862/m.123916 type:complete len:206 (-) Transcript_69862:28-645(-)